MGRADADRVILKRDVPNGDLFYGSLSRNVLIFFYHRERMGCVERLDLTQGHRHISQDVAVEGDAAAENTD